MQLLRLDPQTRISRISLPNGYLNCLQLVLYAAKDLVAMTLFRLVARRFAGPLRRSLAGAGNGIEGPLRPPSTQPGVMGKGNLDQGTASGCGLPPRILARAFW
jgi:hypothetical protein